MRRTFFYTLIILFILFIVFFVFTEGGIKHQKSGAKGFSNTIEESKERLVFIKKLNYKIVPDTIKLVEGKVFYLEKGFRYGNFSSNKLSKNTTPLKSTDDYTNQICISPAFGQLFVGDFLLRGGDSFTFHKMKDTIKREVVTKLPQYDSIYKVAELLIFEDNHPPPLALE